MFCQKKGLLIFSGVVLCIIIQAGIASNSVYLLGFKVEYVPNYGINKLQEHFHYGNMTN